MTSMRIVIVGLSITSSWGNGHATTWRALVRALAKRGHSITFFEWNAPWYAANRDMPRPVGCRTVLYETLEELVALHREAVERADVVILGSYVRDGVAVGEWLTSIAAGVTAFYDIDTPVTLANLSRGGEYLSRELIPRFDLYLSFTGGPTLKRLETEFGARAARALYCSVDPERYHPIQAAQRWLLGYLGTYSADRQPGLEKWLLQPARRLPDERFIVAGPQYPDDIAWSANVERVQHLPPSEHARFYASQRFTLNLTRDDMKAAGWSPSVRLFEAAACGVPIISDRWQGLEELLEPGREIYLVDSADDVLRLLRDTPEEERQRVGQQARQRILAQHTSDRRARELEAYVDQAASARQQSSREPAEASR